MGVELRHVRYLLAVAEHGNFTRAAEDLHISQPTLSQQIKQLERAVGAQLLDRTGRTVRLTDAGEAYTRFARRALRDLAAADRAVHDVADLTRGHLRLGVTPTFTAYLIGPLFAEMHDRHPGITLQLQEMSQDNLESALLADELDLGIAFDRPHPPGITAATLFTEALALVAASGPDIDPARPLPVRNLPGLALLTGDFATRAHIDAYLSDNRARPRIMMEANSIQALTEIIERTPLATILPEAVATDHPTLTTLALDPPLPTRTVVLLARENTYRSAAARAFTELIEKYELPA
ncbi:transcriptional regulator CynR [Nocardia sp. NPDC051030]|uniref:transcriptional regulator CynR n=1 Tax=Nocardia sp. NPDC051030 TaxID=3155162 RepID=UPI003439AA86